MDEKDMIMDHQEPEDAMDQTDPAASDPVEMIPEMDSVPVDSDMHLAELEEVIESQMKAARQKHRRTMFALIGGAACLLIILVNIVMNQTAKSTLKKDLIREWYVKDESIIAVLDFSEEEIDYRVETGFEWLDTSLSVMKWRPAGRNKIEISRGRDYYETYTIELNDDKDILKVTPAITSTDDSETWYRTKPDLGFTSSISRSSSSGSSSSSDSGGISFGGGSASDRAAAYLRSSAFSYSGLVDQLEYEGFSEFEAEYAVKNCGADWYDQALLKAKQYLDSNAFSYKGLIDQLEYEGFSTGEATYGAEMCGADWNEQAVLKAKQYLRSSTFSRSDLIDQLEYEGFTYSQAMHGADHAY